MTYAIRLHEHGGPEVLKWERVEVSRPRRGELRVRQMAAGVNFMDISQRTGRSPIPIELPGGLGNEAAGFVEAVGEGVSDVAAGDRIAYAGGGAGAYAQMRLIPARLAIKLPNEVTFEQAAGMMLKGMTAQVLLKQIYRAKAGDTVLFHAASSGVGLIACQWLKHLGVRVIGTVSSDEKASAALAHGCEHVIVYTRENIEMRVDQITGGAKVPVVFDSLGAATFVKSLNCIQPRGLAVLYGQASGPVGPIDLGVLQAKGSLFVTRPSLSAYTSDRASLLAVAHDLFEIVRSGAVRITLRGSYPLQDAALAHRDVEQRKAAGSTVLVAS
ncbi:quinone oxidoreductase [Bradyrhizobium sp. AUGA SZCCT0240]|uniref:quinone oxidoreductase family protein n=1 Tax=Bradyrhizobium sp. AUGA SZCCT0240 TaxID=2807669 RepID=UPI001BA60A6A|nr:quinone oxidoreductase [Bradyrhizobium sp. AUGA SZCCT0240]MBR1252293.1 quinone oxidoreductase [Bradyrhizobium sp. AUGA SZCCT0240]